METFIKREGLDDLFRKTILAESMRMQRVFVSHGTFDDVRRRQPPGNPSAVAFTRLQQLREGKRKPLDERRFALCKWCGNGVPRDDSVCGVCKRQQS